MRLGHILDGDVIHSVVFAPFVSNEPRLEFGESHNPFLDRVRTVRLGWAAPARLSVICCSRARSSSRFADLNVVVREPDAEEN